ncbi:hypothetical protein SRABI106_03852 [Rahnella aquatilis]|nr:hypothetical protein SRABI106_03852 [Rahnella aquatilis]
MWRAFAGDNGQYFFELQQTGRQRSFTFLAQYNRLSQTVHVDVCTFKDRGYAGIGILHIRRGVTFERQHVVPVEDVIGSTAF